VKSPAEPIHGRCLCGAVRFALTPPTAFHAHCHCRSCRLSHGAPYVTWTGVPLSAFAFEQGEQAVRWYRSSPQIEWGFCATCGSSMLYRAIAEGHPEEPDTDRMYVAVASLTEPMDRPPQAHVSFEERLPTTRPGDGLPCYRGKTDEEMSAEVMKTPM